MNTGLLIAKNPQLEDIYLLPSQANRHGLIAGATGTGKTVSLQKLAESFSNIGVPVFMADVKGDLTGIGKEGIPSDKLSERLKKISITDWAPHANPIELWDVFGEKGLPVRTTISDMGPLLLSRLLDLNETQSGILQITFKIADDHQLLLIDLKDLKSMLQFVGDNASELQTQYGNITSASIGAIQRGLLTLEQQGASLFFGEPMLEIHDLMKVDANGKGIINILAAEKLYQMPKLYATSLLWLLSELFEQLPEVGDLDKPKMVFFFDEAHLLFNGAPKVLLEKVEQVVRLIRSKGVGVYFVSQNPMDIPESILGQLGNRVQHALRAFTPKDQKAIKAAAQTMRTNTEFDTEKTLMELQTGEALISFLDEKGSPSVVQKASVIAPSSRMGPITDEERSAIINQSALYNQYKNTVDRESAYEMLTQQNQPPISKNATVKTSTPEKVEEKGILDDLKDLVFGSTGPRGGKKDGLVQTAAKTATRSISNQIIRGIMGSILGGRKR